MSDLSANLRAIVDELDAAKVLTPAVLATALRHEIRLDDIAPWVRFGAENYVRSLVRKDDRYELRLLCWKASQSSSLHGHGHSSCAFRIVRGSAVETLLGERDRVWAPGCIIDESNRRGIHQVGNAGADPLLTLHIYAPALPVDAPSPRDGHKIVVIGGGYSGVAVAYQALKHATSDVRITIIERGPWLGRGIAYGVDSSSFRLNVPASKMSIDPDLPMDFVEWAKSESNPNAFLSRAQYGEYVVDRFAKMIRKSPGKVRVVRTDAVSIDEYGVSLANGEVLKADRVVVATGLTSRITPSGLSSDPRVIDAWDECGLATLPKQGRILILGSGLSAVDIVTLLKHRGFMGSALVVSRRGLLPRPHLAAFSKGAPLSASDVQSMPTALRDVVRWVRKIVESYVERGEPWQHGIDALRPHSTQLWQKMSPHDRRRFVRAVRPYWEVLRHRAPAEALELFDYMKRERRLETIAGRVVDSRFSTEGIDVEIACRDGTTRHDHFDAIVRCIGPALDGLDAKAPLLESLISRGLAARDPAELGLVTSPEGAIVRSDGVASKRLFAIGAPRRASAWETTAVPDIVAQANTLVPHLLA